MASATSAPETVTKDRLITEEMTLGEVVRNYPDAAMVMMQFGLHCIGCHVAAYETVGQGALAHGLSDKEIGEMLDEMNRIARQMEGAKDAGGSKR
ncbi:DUF1858 domain-containing protein [Candidatus Woesearchaeota archaeon]|nr:DUF1858 domain-containing protein [Candidatus Woesearchaeota archaeon]